MNTLVTAAVLFVTASIQKGPDPEDVKPGWLGFTVFLALAFAVFLLWMSMRKQLRKVDFEEQEPTPREADGKTPS